MLRARSLLLASVVAVAFTALPIATAGAANPADLDPSFGSNGVASSTESNAIETVSGVSVQPDGKIIWGGWGYHPGVDDYGFLAGKLTPAGAPDTAFGNSVGNFARSYFAGGINYGNALAVQPDGRPIIAGSIAQDAGLLVRFTAGGELDTAGFATPVGARQQANFDINAVALQPGGKILTAGTDGNNFKIWRVNSDGSNDFTLQGGVTYLTTDFLGQQDEARGMVVLPGGSFALVGRAHMGPGVNFLAIAKYLENGALDTSFNDDGRVLTSIGMDPVGQAIVAQPDGKLLVAASISDAPGVRSSVLVRYLPNGDLDPTFGSGGISTTPFDGKVGANNLALQADGKIVVTASTSLAPAMVVARFSSNGAPDSGFGAGGYAELGLSAGTDQATSVAIQPDGKLVIGGSVNPLNSIQADDWAVVRLRGGEPTGAPTPIPASKISSPKRSSMKRKSFRRISGTAGPAGSVAKVEIAVRKIDSKSLKKKRCIWLSSNKAKFKKSKSTSKKKCATQVWLRVNGKEKWSYSLKKNKYLPRGSYEIYSRVTLTDGSKQSIFTKPLGNFKKLKLTK